MARRRWVLVLPVVVAAGVVAVLGWSSTSGPPATISFDNRTYHLGNHPPDAIDPAYQELGFAAGGEVWSLGDLRTPTVVDLVLDGVPYQYALSGGP